ncbi:mitogen-activated kinase kinase kinase NPK1-like [Olea europaea subsp. europaea]|uniref:Mitogen-activated kinase kinase kinase NPK1-like n=1 Tax=Olea europaea subsp. europaea TaxID=158383 RepID=A0A8S0RVH6_OLEEU|nr:mitogen-activated kinase kinase kinase NPK1-like [Olea europaea subsp. europaea]
MAGQCKCLFSPRPNEWVKGKIIGSGSFGAVHLAMDKATGSLFVIKSAETEAGLLSLENESEILEDLDSPFIVKCIGKHVSREANGERNYNLFMEYMAGGSLADVAEKFGGALDEKIMLEKMGLKYLHKNGIVHSDLKCRNVLLGSLGNIKLADFGCAKRLIGLKNNKVTLQSCTCRGIGGTPLWMAPEVLRNEGLDFSADIWSLGCTVIEMATGRPPWDGDILNPMAKFFKIACSNELPEFPAHFSQEGLDFLKKCLERNPGKRCTVEKLLDHPFISGKKLKTTDSKDQGAHSPASVLDSGMYENDWDNSPGDPVDCNRGIPFLTRFCHFENNVSQNDRTNAETSDKWITVRAS